MVKYSPLLGKKWNAVLLYFRFGKAITNKDFFLFFIWAYIGGQIILFKIIFSRFLKTTRFLNNCLFVTVITLDKMYRYPHLHQHWRPLKTRSAEPKWHVTWFSCSKMHIWLIRNYLSIRGGIVCSTWNTYQIQFVWRLFDDMIHPLANLC